MAKTTRILIPSDFTVDSLDFVQQSIEESVAEQIDIILVYGNKSSSSASELLGIGLDDQLDMLQSESFLNACRVLYQRYQDRHLNMFADILCTDNKNYLRHYLRGQAVDEIITIKRRHVIFLMLLKRFEMSGAKFIRSYCLAIREILLIIKWH